MVSRTICVSVLFIFLRSIYAIDIDVTGKEVEAYLSGEYNRSSGGCWDLSVIGAINPHESVTLRGGLSAGSFADAASVNAFSTVGVNPFSRIPLRFSLSYIYNGLQGYDVHTHAVLPFVSYNAARAGISYGPNFRFTSFFGESARFEMINSFSIYLTVINDKKRRLEAVVGNFCDFYAKNMGAYSFRVNYAVFVTDNWTVINEIELLQSGSDALTANFYGVAFRSGARYSW